MAVTATVPNKYKYLLKTKQIDESSDVYKMILMQSGFSFDKDAHQFLADISASELTTGNGYTQQNKVLSGVTLTQDNATDKAKTVWGDVTWTAAGGSIGPTGAAVIYNDTVANKPIACCIAFGQDFTTPDGFSFQVQAPELDIS